MLLIVSFSEEIWRARIALPIAADAKPELGVLLSVAVFVASGAPHGTAIPAALAGLLLGFITVRTQGILAAILARFTAILFYILFLGN